jgi:hypothetical protein
MHATEVKREPTRRRRALLLGATVAAVLLVALVVVLVQDSDDAPTTAQAPMTGDAPEKAVIVRDLQLATRFLKAYGAFDVDEMRSYLADDAIIESMGAQDDPRLLVSYLKATGYRQFLDPCRQLGNGGKATGGPVHCTFSFHALRSAEIGRGPFGGSAFNLAVQDGKIVHVWQKWAIKKFSPQVWEPFATWVSKTRPKDAAVMYADETHTGVRLSEESIRLWNRNTQAYADEVKRSD